MKTILLSLVTLQLGLGAAASALEVAVIQTIHGKSYRQCKIVQRDPDGVAFTHLKGTARVLFSDLPASMRAELGYSAKAAADLEQSRAQVRQAKLKAEQLRQERQTELLHAARLAEIKRLTQQQQSIILMQQQAAAFGGPVPAVGFAAPGWRGGYYGGYYQRPAPVRNQGWDNVGIATIGAGSGGIYVPQSGGFYFTGLPQVHYSPTLGYYNPGFASHPAMRQLGTFGVVPGLAAPAAPAVVPGVSIRGSASFPANR